MLITFKVKMQTYNHTAETFGIFYNETGTKLKEHNDKLVIHNERIDKLMAQEILVKSLELAINHLNEKNCFLEKRTQALEAKVESLNNILMKYFAYNKTPPLPETKPPTQFSFKNHTC